MKVDDVKHCIKSAIDEENCENCNLYGQTGEDHCFKDAMRMALQLIEELQAHREAWEKAKRTVKAYLMLEEFGNEYQDDIEKLIDGCIPKEGDAE